jgi:hypothetical protein
MSNSPEQTTQFGPLRHGTQTQQAHPETEEKYEIREVCQNCHRIECNGIKRTCQKCGVITCNGQIHIDFEKFGARDNVALGLDDHVKGIMSTSYACGPLVPAYKSEVSSKRMALNGEIFVAFPSAKPEVEAIAAAERWMAAGYQVALFLDQEFRSDDDIDVRKLMSPSGPIYCMRGNYRGYYRTVNRLMMNLLGDFPNLNVIITAGDDMLPPPEKTPQQIEKEFIEHFSGTFGVMQGTGDRWMIDDAGKAASERICGSPFLGREFILRWNEGRGPFWPEYFHFYGDEELKNTAEAAGLLWQRPDLTIQHDHWQRLGNQPAAHNRRAQTKWQVDKALFQFRQQTQFMGSRPVPKELYDAV